MISIYGDGGILLSIIEAIGTLFIIAFMCWMVHLCFERDE